ncbi:putative E3 ubiquitin-protein ligase UBR7 [Folsomia candida]|uniref:Putative E3 ubiquitin-protein ligase UBR7 n=1 Tax=Folsomia candida TaxID=158441 RepID=A0A226ESB9_FOLCA|nr:putative E3 ubiquitin-protein ligase UBR7 [Folsomia candida]XP_021946589.1 putative E3 ubiquitin-protein ligase UBR7 [Folsomia candida]XP_035704414.1 putative E3 ubiquitin-protein ligase UBR7 [Folsomia candida]OXA60503.1 putative E3 ubiquitin-protein ligase UBR7 [Folsomia candida]
MADGGPSSSEVKEDEEVVTLGEALEAYEELGKLSNAVLGASDPLNCSYSKGYLKRQALYACLTCNPKNAPHFQQGGVCLACSYKCHDGHELVELYTKRNFRCDCGNKKFPDNPCTLQKDKEEYNEKNVYSQNFSGLYCTCHRPYPDPDESAEMDGGPGPMIQCIVCEDWYHSEHVMPVGFDYEDIEQAVELICAGCTPKLNFLAFYGELQVKPSNSASAEVVEDSNAKNIITNGEEPSKHESPSNSQDSGVSSLPETETKSSINPNACPLTDTSCQAEMKPGNGTMWQDGWRKKLCRCDSCKAIYDAGGVSFLLDEEDTIENYEAAGQAKLDSEMVRAEESFTRQMNEMGHVGQIELISGYNNMKEALKDFLEEFANNGKVVQEKDVQEFFENLRATKRPRLDLGGNNQF